MLHHFDASPAERELYLRQAAAFRRAVSGEEEAASSEDADIGADEGDEAETAAGATMLSPERYAEMSAAEQFVLTATELGYGKRSSSYAFRVSGRGGKGIKATDTTKLGEIGRLVAAFPVEPGDEIMLVTDGGKMIRTPVEGIRFVSRASKGVRVFDIAEDEKVVSVEHIPDSGEGENGNGGDDAAGENEPDAPLTE